ncbi:MAG: extracellular solute-binding protein [Candidatus Berkelbacteria bacterium]|nr:extracellular solute-binding protein [Candidatus Berkelbacteria bacterium]
MKRLFKNVSYVLILATFAVALSGCGKTTTGGGGTSQSGQFIVWSFEDADVWKEISRDFEQKNKGYKFVYVKQTLDSEYESRVLNSILSGAGPDVWAMPDDWVYRHKDKLAPMPDTFAKTITKDKFVTSVNDSVLIDDKFYALAPAAEPLIMYYNPKLLTQLLNNYITANPGPTNSTKVSRARFLLDQNKPRTWDEFTEALKIVTQKDTKGKITTAGTALGTDSIMYSQDILYLMMLQQGTDMTNVKSGSITQATFNLPNSSSSNTDVFPGRQALDFYTSFADPTSPNYSWDDSLGNSLEAFVNGKVVFMFGYSSLQLSIAQKYPEFHDYTKAFVPQLDTTSSNFIDYARFSAFGVNRSSGTAGIQMGWDLVTGLATTYSSSFSSAQRMTGASKKTSYDTTLEARSGTNPDAQELGTARSFIKGRYPVEFDSNIRNAIWIIKRKK